MWKVESGAESTEPAGFLAISRGSAQRHPRIAIRRGALLNPQGSQPVLRPLPGSIQGTTRLSTGGALARPPANRGHPAGMRGDGGPRHRHE